MKAVQLTGFTGPENLRLVDIEKPSPREGEILIAVKAAGINFAELEMTYGRYPSPRPLPSTMGFEAAGVVVEVGPKVTNVKVGDRVTSVVRSGGYAEYAIADANMAIPIPDAITFAEASAIPIQGLSAYTLLKYAAKPRHEESILIPSAAGGVGVFLVQLAKLMSVRKVIALAGSPEKLDLVRTLGADVAINYSNPNWADEVERATGGNGVDVVLEANSGDVGNASFRLMAPFGRIVFYGAKNALDTLSSEKVRQLIHKNQSLIGFNFPSLRAEQIQQVVASLLELVASGKVRVLANHSFALEDVRPAFEAIAYRHTFGRVFLTP